MAQPHIFMTDREGQPPVLIQANRIPRVPMGAYRNGSRVIELPGFYVRTLVEYDVDRLRDRLRADLFFGDRPTGFSHVLDVAAELRTVDVAGFIEHYGEQVERAVVDGFFRSIATTPNRLEALETRVAQLEHRLDNTRPKRLARWLRTRTKAAPGRLASIWDSFWKSFYDTVTFQAWRG